MTTDVVIRKEDLRINSTARLPVSLVLDCSPSMSGEKSKGSVVEQTNPRPIAELNEGVKMFFEATQKHDVAQHSVEVSVVTFSDQIKTLVDFGKITRADPPTVELDLVVGGTSIGNGMRRALELVDAAKKEYKEAGVDYFQPWVVLMTDGHPTDNTHIDVSSEVSDLVLNNKLTVFPVGIGDGADMNVLAMFSPKKAPLKLKGLKFKEFFKWIFDSAVMLSQSIPGETVKMDPETIKTWADLEN